MNTNGLIKLVMRIVARKGVNGAIDLASRRGKAPDTMTPEERNAARSTRKNSHAARRGLQILRRFMR